jgi:hypothetical protein
MPLASGTDTQQQQQTSETKSEGLSLVQRCSDAYWFLDSSYTLSDKARMASALAVVVGDIQRWAEHAEGQGAILCAAAIRGVAERINEKLHE